MIFSLKQQFLSLNMYVLAKFKKNTVTFKVQILHNRHKNTTLRAFLE